MGKIVKKAAVKLHIVIHKKVVKKAAKKVVKKAAKKVVKKPAFCGQESKNQRCGVHFNHTWCPPKAFCSLWGWCGVGAAWEMHSFNSAYNWTPKYAICAPKPAPKHVIKKVLKK